MNVQNVLDQFELRLIQIRYIQIWYIQFRLKIGWFRVNQTRGRNSSTSICPVDRVSCPDMEIQVFRNASSRGPGFMSWQGDETRSTGTCIPEKLGSLCQDMKPGPQGKLMYYYFYHGSDLREIIQFLHKIECIEFECNKFILVLFRIDLIHFEHPICISSTRIKTNTNPLVQLQYIRYI